MNSPAPSWHPALEQRYAPLIETLERSLPASVAPRACSALERMLAVGRGERP